RLSHQEVLAQNTVSARSSAHSATSGDEATGVAPADATVGATAGAGDQAASAGTGGTAGSQTTVATVSGGGSTAAKKPNIIEQLWTQNPMMFPTNASTDGHFFGAAKLASNAGVKKVATVFCTEVAACQNSNDVFVAHAKSLGIDVVYQGRISFTQPDYTA